MKGIRLEPAQSLLSGFTHAELVRLVRRARLDITPPRSRPALIQQIASHLTIDDIVDKVHVLFPKPRGKTGPGRLDVMAPGHGAVTIQAASGARPDSGDILLETGDECLVLRLATTPLFLENRWPVIATGAGAVPHARLYAAFVRPDRVHAEAQAAPPKTKPFIVDEGEYQLRNGRLHMELSRSGPISFLVVFLRCRGARPEFLLEPIA
jgi:hypothetical protein